MRQPGLRRLSLLRARGGLLEHGLGGAIGFRGNDRRRALGMGLGSGIGRVRPRGGFLDGALGFIQRERRIAEGRHDHQGGDEKEG
jgi:hypothetical protein